MKPASKAAYLRRHGYRVKPLRRHGYRVKPLKGGRFWWVLGPGGYGFAIGTTRLRAIAAAYPRAKAVQALRRALCECPNPLLGSVPGAGPRCRLCNTEAKLSR